MREAHGLWVPDIGEKQYYVKYHDRANELAAIIKGAKKKRVAVQAGGHIGCVPLLLAKNFASVYTFEPERENFSCLARNTESRANIYAARGTLGNARGPVGLAVHSRSSGGHNVVGSGPVPCYRVDDLALPHLDLLALDVEGMEVPALWGALLSIELHKPLIIVEENKKTHGKGNEFGDAERLLAPFGYKQVDSVGEDLVFAA